MYNENLEKYFLKVYSLMVQQLLTLGILLTHWFNSFIPLDISPYLQYK